MGLMYEGSKTLPSALEVVMADICIFILVLQLHSRGNRNGNDDG